MYSCHEFLLYSTIQCDDKLHSSRICPLTDWCKLLVLESSADRKKLALINMIWELVSKMRNEAIREVHIHYLALISFL